MQHTHFMQLRLSLPEDVGCAAAWSDDHDPEVAANLANQNRQIGARIGEALPDLALCPLATEELPEFPGFVDEPETMIRRLHRFVRLIGPWTQGRLTVSLCDRVVELEVGVDSALYDPRSFVAAFVQLLASLESATGMQSCIDGHAGASAVVQALTMQHREALRRVWKAGRRDRRLHRFGPFSAALMTVLAILIMAGIIADAIDHGTLAERTDPSQPAVFVTTALVPPYRALGLFPRFALEGWVESPQPVVRLRVYRDEYLRAAPGARFAVLPTRDASEPWILRTAFDRLGPRWSFGGWAIAWFAWVATLPFALWGIFVARPWLRTRGSARDAMRVTMTRRLLTIGKVAVVLGLFVVLRGVL